MTEDSCVTSSPAPVRVPGAFESKLSHLPRWLQMRLASCPKSPRGVHQWIWSSARRLLHFYDDHELIFKLLRERTQDNKRVGRRVRDREIRDQIKSASQNPWRPAERRH